MFNVVEQNLLSSNIDESKSSLAIGGREDFEYMMVK